LTNWLVTEAIAARFEAERNAATEREQRRVDALAEAKARVAAMGGES